SNTTACAAVLAAQRHADLATCKALVLGGTGPVGQRVALLLARQGAEVWLASRTQERAQEACDAIQGRLDSAELHAIDNAGIASATQYQVIISAGAAGVQLLSRSDLGQQKQLQVVIDLNAVPPAGIEGIEVTDSAKQ